jgi:polyisoprenyl-phosphate glycosyltransferase
MKLLSVVTPCYNEEESIDLVYERVKRVLQKFGDYNYEHIFIDNCSTDGTIAILKHLAAKDKRVKIIINARNFGHIRSPYYALLQAKGDAVISLVADLQDPPELLEEFVKKWEEGYKIVIGVKNKSKENPVMNSIRKLHYHLMERLSAVDQIKNFTGFGLYDRKIIEILKLFKEPYPYFRGLIAEIGFDRAEIEFVQPKREKGKTKNNFYTLYDLAILGFVSHSKIPLRISVFLGFGLSVLSFVAAVGYLVYKLIFWDRFQVGVAPLVIGLFFFFSVILFFIGIIGEYIGVIYTKIMDRPLVIEKERINFD